MCQRNCKNIEKLNQNKRKLLKFKNDFGRILKETCE